MDIQDHTVAYQSYLEALRRNPDNQELKEDCHKARTELEISYGVHRIVNLPQDFI